MWEKQGPWIHGERSLSFSITRGQYDELQTNKSVECSEASRSIAVEWLPSGTLRGKAAGSAYTHGGRGFQERRGLSATPELVTRGL